VGRALILEIALLISSLFFFLDGSAIFSILSPSKTKFCAISGDKIELIFLFICFIASVPGSATLLNFSPLSKYWNSTISFFLLNEGQNRVCVLVKILITL